MKKNVRKKLREGVLIPAHPLALNRRRKLDERRQRALTRYYLSAGAGGVAVGVHTTQFAIREAGVGLLRPVLELAAETIRERENKRIAPVIAVAGVCGKTGQAVWEATLARDLGYHAGLLSLAALSAEPNSKLIEHARAVAEVLPVFGFYLQPSVGGRVLDYAFWREFCAIENVVAIKIAPFNRYQTIDVVRAVCDAGRQKDIALYTGNDDNIVLDLVTPYRFSGMKKDVYISGGLLGHWAVWTRRALEYFQECQRTVAMRVPAPTSLLRRGVEVTDANAAFFDPPNGFKGCIAGIHEVLRRQGLLEGIWLLDPKEGLSKGQAAEIDRIYESYPHLHDDLFVAEHLDAWLA